MEPRAEHILVPPTKIPSKWYDAIKGSSSVRDNVSYVFHRIDPKRRYVEYSCYAKESTKGLADSDEAIFFDEEGIPIAKRTFLHRDSVHIAFYEPWGTKNFHFYQNGTMIVEALLPRKEEAHDFWQNKLIQATYMEGALQIVKLCENFGIEGMEAPSLTLQADMETLYACDSHYFENPAHNQILYDDQLGDCMPIPDGATCNIQDKTGQALYRTSYELAPTGNATTFSQTHLASGARRSITLPFYFDQQMNFAKALEPFEVDPISDELITGRWNEIPINKDTSFQLPSSK